VRHSGGEIGYGATHDTAVAVADLPLAAAFSLTVEGDGPISIRAINDITDFDDPSYHQGKMTIAHANSGRSFEIIEGTEYGFTVTLDATATSGSTYEIEVAIENNDSIMPNPYIFRYRVTVTP